MVEAGTIICRRLDTDANINLFLLRTRKFKTVTIKVFVTGRLDETVEEQAILPFILKRGSHRYPSQSHIAKTLEKLYGAKFVMDIFKLGDSQVLAASLDVVNDRFLTPAGAPRNGPVREGVGLLRDVLTNPLSKEGAFLPEPFEREKRNLERFIRSLINNKVAYANTRLVQEMYKGNAFGNFVWGETERVAALDPAAAYGYFKSFFQKSPVDVFVMGDVSESEALELSRLLWSGVKREGNDPDPPGGNNRSPAAACETIQEDQPLEQSKLAMGFHVDRDCGDDLYYALFFYNAILGGGSFSKIFKRVREKESLAYYAHSVYDKVKGFLRVSAGIHRDHCSKVIDIIGELMNDISEGRISDEEFSNARKSLLSGLRAVRDNPGQLIDYYLVARRAGRETSIDRIMDKLTKVKREHVASASRLVSLGKIFFLKGTTG